MAGFKYILDKDYSISSVDRRLFGSFIEHVARSLYRGIYEPEHETANEAGFRRDIIELVRELNISHIRYPGGNFVSGYHWKDGVGPKEERPVRLNYAWNALEGWDIPETNAVGFDEFYDLSKKMKVEVMPAVNLGTGTPEEAAELVEYCNYRGGTYWSDLRRKYGHEQPYGLKTWCLGNEMDGKWQIGQLSPEDYAKKAREAAKLMRVVDPAIELVACGSCTNITHMPSYPEWNRIVLDEIYEYVDYLSLHKYYTYDPKDDSFYPHNNELKDVPYFPIDLCNFIDTVGAAIDFIKGKHRTNKNIYISFDEWGVFNRINDDENSHKKESEVSLRYTITDALIYGAILCTFLNKANRVKIACQSLLVNCLGMITTGKTGSPVKESIYYPFLHVSSFAKGVTLQQQFDNPLIETEHYGKVSSICSAATWDEESGALTIFAVNMDQDDDCNISLDLRSFGKLCFITRIEMYDKDITVYNDKLNPDRIKPVVIDCGGEPVENNFQINLKKYSWNVIILRKI